MPLYLKQSTASQEIPLGIFVDSTTGDIEQAGLTINNTDIKLWKSGATTLASKNSGGATYISNGIYYCVLDATDTDTLGSLVIFIHVATALAVKVECVVLAANVYDSLIGGTDLLDVSTAQVAGQTASAAAGVTFPSSIASPTNITAGVITTTTNLTNAPTNGDFTAAMKTSLNAATPASVVGSVGSVASGVVVTTNNDKTGYALTTGERTSIADALLDRDMAAGTDSGGRTVRNALRLLRNKVAIALGTMTVYKEDDAASAWTAVVTTDAAADPITAVDP